MHGTKAQQPRCSSPENSERLSWIDKMAKQPKQLEDLFHNALKDTYFAEKKILATLPKLARAAQRKELKAAFEKHRGETAGHVERLDQVFAKAV